MIIGFPPPRIFLKPPHFQGQYPASQVFNNRDNPFNSPEATHYTCYVSPEQLSAHSDKVKHGHHQVKALIEVHPCIGAQAALAHQTYRFGLYPQMDNEAVTQGLCRDLFTFLKERESWNTLFTKFIASFETPHPRDESHFETLLWQQLSTIARVDSPYHPWPEAVLEKVQTGDIASFRFQFADQEFFVVGLNPSSTRHARRFAYPTLVFNLQERFDHFKANGQFEPLARKIQKRDADLTGQPNPNLALPDPHQYSGKQNNGSWQCPFHLNLIQVHSPQPVSLGESTPTQVIKNSSVRAKRAKKVRAKKAKNTKSSSPKARVRIKSRIKTSKGA